MRQDLDFLKSVPKAPLQLPAKWITFAFVNMLALLTLISLGMLITQIQDHRTLKHIQSENLKTIETFHKIAKAHPLLASNTPLTKQIKILKEELDNQKSYYTALTRVALRYGFSHYMDALAMVVPKGLWLNEININQTKKTATLGGYMLQPVEVSSFLAALQNIGAFSGTTFNLFYVKAVPETSVIEFKITNKKTDLDA